MGTKLAPDLNIEQVIQIELPTRFAVGPVNVYLIQSEKLTLVDTSPKHEENWELLNQALREHGYSIQDIEQVVLTHHHADHVGLLERILEANPVPVYGHPNCRPWIRQDPEFYQWHQAFFAKFYQELGVPFKLLREFQAFQKVMEKVSCRADLTGELIEGTPIPGLPEWRIIETKGHAQSHISLFRERDGLLIAGDHVIKHISSNALLEPPQRPGAPRVKPLLQYMENLRKCAELPVTLTLSGHGQAVKDLPALVEQRLEKIEERAGRIKEILAEGAETAFEVVQALFPDKYEKEIGLTVSEVVGHLDLLLARGEIREEKKNGILIYRLAEDV